MQDFLHAGLSPSPNSFFPLRVAVCDSVWGTAVNSSALECMIQTSYSFTDRLHKLSYLLISVGSMSSTFIIMSSNCFIFTRAGYQPGSDLTVCAVIYIWIVIMLNILYWLLILEDLQRTDPVLQAETKTFFFFFQKPLPINWVKINSESQQPIASLAITR